jgi:hypothetical protein
MAVYLTPGIYRHARQTERRDVQLVRTDVAGFAGFTERGPLVSEVSDPRRAVVRITSWKEFVATFGGFTRYGYLAYAVRAFFENGGTTCHVVRVAGISPALSMKERLGLPRRAKFAMPWREKTLPQNASIQLETETAEGASSLALADAQHVKPGDLLRITQVLQNPDPTIREIKADEFAMVVERDGNTVHLGTRLRFAYLKKPELRNAELRVFDPAFRVTATSAGNWGSRLSVTITPLENAQEFSLRVRVERPRGFRGEATEEEFFNHLSLDKGTSEEPNPYFAPLHINTVSNLLHIDVTQSLIGEVPSMLLEDTGSLVCGKFSLQGGQDGMARLEIRDVTGGTDDLRGIRLLEEIDEVAILCTPDAVLEPVEPSTQPPAPIIDPCNPGDGKPPGGSEVVDDATAEPPALQTAVIYRAMIDQCERRRDRVAILDTPARVSSAGDLKTWRELFFTRFAALYYPWLVVPDEAGMEGPTRRIPPSGHVAGIYARTDNSHGVHWPPANAPLDFVNDVAEEISDLEQQNLNPYGINAIRSFHGRGIRLWGARSLAGNSDADWRFIHVRRLMSMIEESVDKSTQWAVFEPNDEALRRTLVHSLSVFLEVIWRQGGLKGDRPAQGFYVKCDETNNPTAIVDAGQVVCEIGVAVAAPMEFLVFEIRQLPGAAELVER